MKSEKSFLGEFLFNNDAVECFEELIIDSSNGEYLKNLAIKSVGQKCIKMGYTIGDGLKVINTKQRKNNPLGEFLGIKKDDFIGIKSFFEKYGFLYPISEGIFEKFYYSDFFVVQNQIQAFINLVNNQNEFNQNFTELIDCVLFLIFNIPKIKSECLSSYFRKENAIKNLINTPIQLSENHKNFKFIKDEQGQKIGYFIRQSSVLNNVIKFSKEEIQDIEQDKYTPNWCKNILKLFFCLDNIEIDIHNKQIIEFLFALIYLANPFDIECTDLHNFLSTKQYDLLKENKHFTESLFTISKLLIISEFENALKFVTPTYNVIDMKPDWKLPSLISAFYFSIYYKNSKNIIYRQCSNINCNQYFEVSSTNSKKIYCSTGCSENKNARMSRARKKQGS